MKKELWKSRFIIKLKDLIYCTDEEAEHTFDSLDEAKINFDSSPEDFVNNLVFNNDSQITERHRH